METLSYVLWPLAGGAAIYVYLPFTCPVLFLATLGVLTAKIWNDKYLRFWPDAVMPSLKITAIQLVVYAFILLATSLISPWIFLFGLALFHVIQIYLGQKIIHQVAGKGLNIWSTKALGLPAGLAVLILLYVPFIALYVWIKR